MKAPGYLLFRFLLATTLFSTLGVSAQSWMPGFNYRKSITMNKAQVSGAVNLIDFQVLISITDPDLKYLVGQCNDSKISSAAGLDISFAAAASPSIPLRFQIDTYDPNTGTLNCWVNLPVLSASGGTTASTMLYLYYGSKTLQDPLAPNAVATWTGMSKLWHMNLDVQPAASMNARYNTAAEMAVGTGLMNSSNFSTGKIGAAVKLNGTTESMNAAKDTSTTFTISAWIKMSRIDVEQVLISNDSTGVGGYIIKVNSSGNLTLDIKKGASSSVITLVGGALLANQWYHVAICRDGRTKSIYINGKVSAGASRIEGVGAGGRVSIGRGKQNDRYFAGMIDELRISNQFKTADWLKTEYNNQNDPASFYLVGAEEKNPVQGATGYLFTGALNSSWSEPANWNSGRVPESYANVVIPASTKVNMQAVPDGKVNQLTLETGSILTVQNTQLLVCKMQLKDSAKLQLSGNSGIQLNGDVLNNGTITGADIGGSMTFGGNQAITSLSGSGSVQVYDLHVSQATAASQLNLNQSVRITGRLELKTGVLNTNGNLTLAASKTQSAAVMPISSLSATRVIGDVTVEKYVDGSFPSPATARGWRLWSSPVYTSEGNGLLTFNLNALKSAVFITGKGGAANGFDDSPQNGNTIFTHDQSIAGNLSQKYVPVPALAVQIPLGRGIYVYSRGSRNSQNALQEEVLSPPFINPAAFTIRYTGKLFSGDLKVLLSNRNRQEPGDGFNLLGNPYASSLSWGALLKENTTAFIWMFNPLNNAYDVSDDPNFNIPAGAGFFVKVSTAAVSGSVTFSEAAKVSAATGASNQAITFTETPAASRVERQMLAAEVVTNNSTNPPQAVHRRLETLIIRDAFSQRYLLKIDPAGSDEVTDEDALSLGDGYVNIAGLSPDKQKLMVDSRGIVDLKVSVPLYVKGWATGTYHLDFAGFDSFEPEDSILLIDKYAGISALLTKANNHYAFQIDDGPQSQGLDRFSLLVKIGMHHPEPATTVSEQAQIRIFPNPFTDVISVVSKSTLPQQLQFIIRDLMGRQVLSREVSMDELANSTSINGGSLPRGIYILEIRDEKLHTRLKTSKIIKL